MCDTQPKCGTSTVVSRTLVTAPLGEIASKSNGTRIGRQVLFSTRISGVSTASNAPLQFSPAVRKQVPVAVQNALTVLKGNALTNPDKYNGYGSCPLVTGYGKLVLAEFNYEGEPDTSFPIDQGKERWSMYQLKKRVLPWLYWNKILKGTA